MALDFFAGFLGGCAGVLVGHPLDTVKVKIQTQDHRNPLYKGTYDCLKSIIKNESVSGLYKGMSSPMAGVAVVNAIVFGVYGNIQRRMPEPDSLTSVFVAGTAAGLVQSFVCSPMEMVKTRVQVQETQIFKSPLQCLRHVYKTQGVRGVFQGLNITAMREGPGFGVYFLSYELLTRTEDKKPIGTLHMLGAGGLAGAISWFFAYPFDVIKSRIQVDGMIGARKYKNSMDCLVKSLKAEGYPFLFKGLNSTLVRAFPVNAATWAVVTWTFRCAELAENKDNSYETVSEYVTKHKPERQIFHISEQNLFNLHSLNLNFYSLDITQKYYVPNFNIQLYEKCYRSFSKPSEVNAIKKSRVDNEKVVVAADYDVINMADNYKNGVKSENEAICFEGFIEQLWTSMEKSFL